MSNNSPAYDCFELTIEDRIAHIVLNRPSKRNAMNPAFWRELPAIVSKIDSESLARVIVISSTGPHFTAGLDIGAFLTPDSGETASREKDPKAKRVAGAKFYQKVKQMQASFSALEDCRVPVLVAIQGGCIGGGVDLVTACDIRYASSDAFFSIQETNIGMTADVGTFPRLVKLIPEGIVREMAYTGRRVPADEAKDAGLVNRVFESHEALLEGVMEVARDIASKAPLAVYGCKRVINYSRDHNTADSLDYIGIWNASMLQPEEMMEAMQANAEGRPGDFADLPRLLD